jgi:hypothetical protein
MAKSKKTELENNFDIDKKKLVIELKQEVKETIIDDLLSIIEKETKDKLDKMEKKIYKYKNTTIRKRNILILILLVIIILETKVLYDNNLLNFSKNNNASLEQSSDITSNTNDNIKDSNWYLENYSYLIDNIKTNLSSDDITYLYQGNYTETTINNNIRLNMAYQLLDNNEITIENSVITISEEDLKDNYKKIFGSLDNYKAENFTNNCIQFIYNKTMYMAIDTNCNDNSLEIIEKIKNIYEEDNNIIIETIVGLYNNSDNSLSNINNQIVVNNYSKSDNLSNLEDKLNSYKYTFQKIDNNYYLKEINKVK